MKAKNIIKLVFCVILSCVLVLGCVGCFSATSTREPSEAKYNENKAVIATDEVKKIAEDSIKNKSPESVESSTIPNSDEVMDESDVIDEGAIESDAVIEQENISYDGVNTGKGKSLLGKTNGKPLYYSQIDSRWKNKMYSNHNDKSQTIGTSGCGVCSAAMVISTSKGVITPPTIAKLFVDNGYRTANNGTAWAAWSFIADYFDFDYYETTKDTNKVLKYLSTDKNKNGNADYIVVASCGYGLWTSAGHYIVLAGYNNGKVRVLDPYLYNGKFTTASRKAAGVKVKGTNAYVTAANFKKYSNVKNYWVFSNDYKVKKATTKATTKAVVKTTKPSAKTTTKASTKAKTYVRYVDAGNSNLNVRKSANGNAKIVTKLKTGTKVTVYGTSKGWSKIGTNKWVSTKYLSKTKPVSKATVKYKTTVNGKYKLKKDTAIYSNKNLSGNKYNYRKGTKVKVLSHATSKIDKIYVVKTKRTAYISVNNLTK